MKIYTRKGDSGQTALFGGERVSKAAIRVEAYGTLDELNAALGACLVELGADRAGVPIAESLRAVQSDLFALGAELATPPGAVAGGALLDETRVQLLEDWIDALDSKLPPLTQFILPGGTAGGAALHAARTICRRAERRVVALGDTDQVRPLAVTYLNRLSDWLFVAARATNQSAGVTDTHWQPERTDGER